MKKSFRFYHLLQIVDSDHFLSTPLDLHLGRYFRSNRAIGSKDRKYISEKIYQVVRYRELIDFLGKKKMNWEERLQLTDEISLERQVLNPKIPEAIRANVPKELFDRIEKAFGLEKAFSICLTSNTIAPATIRVNPIKASRTTLFSQLSKQFDVSLTKDSTFGIMFKEKFNFASLDEFKQGFFEVQDEGSQEIASLVEPLPGQSVLDYCAGAGGKALAFAHRLQGKGQIYLHDIRLQSLLGAKKRLKRAGIENAQILPHDAKHKSKLKKKMDWVLVDSPCTGVGTLRRNPDIKWKFSDQMLKRLVQEQREIFASALDYLKPGGKIVYATCSFLPEENEEQVDFFQKTHHLSLAEPLFSCLPQEGGKDGFFGAILKQIDV